MFVATLHFSGNAYAEVFDNEKLLNWIQAHIHLFEFLQGVSTLLIPDNLKTAVQKNTKSDLLLNQSYEDLANHYHAIVAHTRVRKPKNKAAVENTIKQLTTHLIARMRHYQCFSVTEYNYYLHQELDKYNQRPFQKKEGSRAVLFKKMEQPLLKLLPTYPYEYCEYRQAKVYSNSHISYDKHYYSVPHQFIAQTVQVKVFKDRIEIYHQG